MNIVDILAISWKWCAQDGVQGVLHLIRSLIGIIRIVVPIGLIVMTTLDIAKKVINPEDKDGQKKIMHRVIAAVIVFLVPTFITLTFKIIDRISNVSGDAESILYNCWPE